MGEAKPSRAAAEAFKAGKTNALLDRAEQPAADDLRTQTYRLHPRHVSALLEEAVRRKMERGVRGRADASAVLRDVIDEWLQRGER